MRGAGIESTSHGQQGQSFIETFMSCSDCNRSRLVPHRADHAPLYIIHISTRDFCTPASSSMGSRVMGINVGGDVVSGKTAEKYKASQGGIQHTIEVQFAA